MPQIAEKLESETEQSANTNERTAQFLSGLTELSRKLGIGIAVGVAEQAPTLFVLDRDDCDDFTRVYRIDDEARLFFD